MKRKDLKKMSENRLKAIKASYESGLYNEVVSDAGLVLEFALKAAVCKAMNRDTYPEEIKNYRTHNLEKLVNIARLRDELDKEKRNNTDFYTNWSLLSAWDVNFRYMPPGLYNKESAEDYINAIEAEEGGIYQWIKTKW